MDYVCKEMIAFEHIHSIGRDAIMVRQGVIIQKNYIWKTGERYCLREILDKQVYTEAGISLGILADVMFDRASGEIKGYQLSDGILSDIIFGRLTMPLPPVQAINEDRMIVPQSMAKLLHFPTEFE